MIYLSVEPTIRTVIYSPPANKPDHAARIWESPRQEYDSSSICSRIDTQSCGARSVIQELLRRPTLDLLVAFDGYSGLR